MTKIKSAALLVDIALQQTLDKSFLFMFWFLVCKTFFRSNFMFKTVCFTILNTFHCNIDCLNFSEIEGSILSKLIESGIRTIVN